MRYPAVMGVTRPAFLVLTPVCVLLGLAAVATGGVAVDWFAAALTLIGAIAAHVSVNALNEYEDFRSGLDFRTDRTPFSGGSGTLVAHPELASQAQIIGLGSLFVSAACGLILLSRAGWGLLPVGLLGLALVCFYTTRINHNRFLCLIAPGLGFGPLMVVGTHYAVTGGWSLSAAVASLVPFFLVSNLLLLNEFPDAEADRSVGRDTLPVGAGLPYSLRVYGLFALFAYLSIALGVAVGALPGGALLGLLTLPVVVLVYAGVNKALKEGGSLVPRIAPLLGLNVAVALITPALVAIGLLLTP
ncbi:MAG: prenyltransferase [Pseudomonadota bacterium]|nr:prenyltransferase [Pseudomonadota bacterium]